MPKFLVPTVLLLLGLSAIGTAAQFRGYRGAMTGQLPEQRDGFTFCRLVYTEIRSEALGQGWITDFPAADENLMLRLSQLTKTEVTWHAPNRPAYVLVRATDPEIYLCPFLFASDVGTVGFSDQEVVALREYLLKGGFLWVDDFWGPDALRFWLRQIGRVLPESNPEPIAYGHPILSTFYFIDDFPQIPSIQYWRSSGGGTSERGNLSSTPMLYGMNDSKGRLVVLMSHNTDIADGWEREGEDYEFFHRFSPRGYAVGINVAVWTMTH